MKKKKIILFIITILSLILGIFLIVFSLSGKANEKVYEDGRFSKLDKTGNKIFLQDDIKSNNFINSSNIKIESVNSDNKGPSYKDNKAKNELANINFPKLQNKVPNLIGWLSIPELGIDQPIAQANDNNYYLTHNIFDEEDPAGSVFLESNSSLSDPVKYIYGHYWTKNDMFGPLGKLINDRYPYTNAIITDDKNNIKTYQLLGVKSTDNDKGFNMQHFNSINDEFNEWSEKYYNLHAQNYKYSGFAFNKEVLILITCHSRPDEPGRIIAYFQEV